MFIITQPYSRKRRRAVIPSAYHPCRDAFPDARKITRDIFEIRVMHEGTYRGFYAYLGHPNIVILHFFQKKTQRTPVKHIKLAERRLQDYE
ncbi:MAG: type II toxin-antitoxin system RelE/ParE family toxin [Parcubacteria group bacterium]|nr:type II toxin-antitoxin system RelE/ParE family toxin [Candidatus Vogelbacteria bacterium]MBI2050645.1 type II toxin-antitoxin system RelE/ParE family toxin [Parcubacteria group bacterium]